MPLELQQGAKVTLVRNTREVPPWVQPYKALKEGNIRTYKVLRHYTRDNMVRVAYLNKHGKNSGYTYTVPFADLNVGTKSLKDYESWL